jgi:hypothetical protein
MQVGECGLIQQSGLKLAIVAERKLRDERINLPDGRDSAPAKSLRTLTSLILA